MELITNDPKLLSSKFAKSMHMGPARNTLGSPLCHYLRPLHPSAGQRDFIKYPQDHQPQHKYREVIEYDLFLSNFWMRLGLLESLLHSLYCLPIHCSSHYLSQQQCSQFKKSQHAITTHSKERMMKSSTVIIPLNPKTNGDRFLNKLMEIELKLADELQKPVLGIHLGTSPFAALKHQSFQKYPPVISCSLEAGPLSQAIETLAQMRWAGLSLPHQHAEQQLQCTVSHY